MINPVDHWLKRLLDIRVIASYPATPQITPRESGKVKVCNETEVPGTTFDEQVGIVGRIGIDDTAVAEYNLKILDNVIYKPITRSEDGISATSVKPATPTSYPESESAFLLRKCTKIIKKPQK